jgi:hypothetical protein
MRELLVFGDKTFKIKVSDDSKITFAPFSPPRSNDARGFGGGDRSSVGTLRIYAENNEKKIIAVFAGVRGFRDLGLEYMEEVAREEGAILWKSDEKGYTREDKRSAKREWISPELPPAEDKPEEEEEVW